MLFEKKKFKNNNETKSNLLEFPNLWSDQKPWWNWYLTLVVNFDEVQKAQLDKSTLLTSTLVEIFSDLLRSVQMLKRKWGAEINGKLPHLFILGKSADLVPEFVVEDLTLADLQPRFLRLQWMTYTWAEHSDVDSIIEIYSICLKCRNLIFFFWNIWILKYHCRVHSVILILEVQN